MTKRLLSILGLVVVSLITTAVFPHSLAANEHLHLPTPYIDSMVAEEAEKLTLQTLVGPVYEETGLNSGAGSNFQEREVANRLTITSVKLEFDGREPVPFTSESVGTTDEKSHFLLLLDNSGSMQSALGELPPNAVGTANNEAELLYPAGSAKGEAQRVVSYFEGEDPGQKMELALWSFNEEIRPELTFTADKRRIRSAIAATPMRGGETCLYDAVTTAVAAVDSFTASRHRGGIILFTDGRDEVQSAPNNNTPCSQKATLADAVRVAQAAFVPIHIFLFEGSEGSKTAEMAALAKASGGQFVDQLPRQEKNKTHLAALLNSLQQWRASGEVYALRGTHTGELVATFSDGSVITKTVAFQAPRDFPRPVTLTKLGPDVLECQEGLACSFAYKLEDPDEQISHLKLQLRRVPEQDEDEVIIGGSHLVTKNDDRIAPSRTEAASVELVLNELLAVGEGYKAVLTAVSINENIPTTTPPPIEQPITLVPPPAPLEVEIIPWMMAEPPDPVCADTDDLARIEDKQIQRVAARLNALCFMVKAFLEPEPEPNTAPQIEPTEDGQGFQMRLAVTNGKWHEAAWQSVDIYVRQRRWRWFRFQEEGYEYPCQRIRAEEANQANAEPTEADEQSCQFELAEGFATGTITVPHRLEPRTTLVMLQARGEGERPLLPIDNLPQVREVNWLGRLAATITNLWEDWGLWLGLLLLALAILLTWWLISHWQRTSRETREDKQDADLLQFSEVVLTVVSSPDTKAMNQKLTLGDSTIAIGREGCTLNIPADGHLSRRHAEIGLAEGGYFIKDLSSENGTQIRQTGRPFETVGATRPTTLNVTAGVDIQLGYTMLRIEEQKV